MGRVRSFRVHLSSTHKRASYTGDPTPDSDNRVYYRGLRVYL